MEPTLADPSALALAGLALLLGGVLKGATGAGSPIVAIPVLSLLYGVPFAVTVFVLPNLLTNLWQLWQYRQYITAMRFAAIMAVSGGIGAGLGSVMLAHLPAQSLMLGVGVMVLLYVSFRLARPGWRLPQSTANTFVVPVGFFGGMMQGASGISAPISLTFLNAIGFERSVFIVTISAYFTVVTASQIPVLWSLGLLDTHRVLQSLLAFGVIFLGLPIGEALAKRMSATVFDRITLALLSLIGLRLIWVTVL